MPEMTVGSKRSHAPEMKFSLLFLFQGGNAQGQDHHDARGQFQVGGRESQPEADGNDELVDDGSHQSTEFARAAQPDEISDGWF